MNNKLVKILKDSGKDIETYISPDGSEVLVLPYGGRILGLFAHGDDNNFYWTNPALESIESAKAFFASDQWQNSGGDRTWLAPEIDFFLPKFPDTTTYFQPRQLDPGNYRVVQSHGNISMVNQFSITTTRGKSTMELKITKSIGPAPNPLRHERGLAEQAGVHYAGYTLSTGLEKIGNKKTDPVGLWNLVQMPQGGDLFVVTYGKAEPVICFGKVDKNELIADEGLLTFKMQSNEGKITIPAISTTGRVGYMYPSQNHWCLIVRNFTVNPSGEYIDPPWKDPDHLGYSTQACNVHGDFGFFSELEYHAPAIAGQTGLDRYEDNSQVWAFRADKEQIKKIAQKLLSLNIT